MKLADLLNEDIATVVKPGEMVVIRLPAHLTEDDVYSVGASLEDWREAQGVTIPVLVAVDAEVTITDAAGQGQES